MNNELENMLEKINALYKRYGIKSVTMDDVARELGVSKKTLYNFFCDKNDLVSKVIELEIRKKEEEINNLISPGNNAIEGLLSVFRYIKVLLRNHSPASEYDLRKYYPQLYQKVFDIRKDRLLDIILVNIKRGKKEGLYRKDINEELLAKLHVSRIIGIPDDVVFTIDEFISPKNYFEIILCQIRGIATEKGIKFLEGNLKKFKTEEYNLT